MIDSIDLKLKFYADTPAGQRNKYFVFKVKSFDHGVDLAARFVQERGFIIRAAFLQVKEGVSRRLDKDFNLNERVCSLIDQNDIEQLLSIVKQDVETLNQEMYQEAAQEQYLNQFNNKREG